MRPTLRTDRRTREVARPLLRQRPPRFALMPFQAVTFGLAETMRWAFR